MLGVQCCYSVQINRGSATLQLLGMDENKVSLAWLAGPLSGLMVQPLAIQAPLRALVTDVASEGQQPLGNAYIGLMTGCGNLVGSFLSSRSLTKLFPIFRTDVQALFAAAAFILCLTVGLCVTYVREKPTSAAGQGYQRAPSERSAANVSSARAPRFGSGSDDESFGDSDGGANLFTWFGFFTLFVFVNTWVGRNIYLGSSSAAEGSDARRLFEAGVRLGGLGNCLTAFVTVVYSPMITSLLERYGTRRTYAFSQLVEALCLFAAFFIRGTPGQEHPSLLLKTATLITMGAFGVVWATTMAVPWALVGAALNRRYPGRVGLFTTLFNVSQSFPQLFVSLGSPWILDKVGGDVSVVMAIGGLFALVGGALIFVLRVDLFDDDVEERSVYELEDTVRDEGGERQEPMY
ncbi:hypothetical protein I4F81_005949 [Pyropia yezoensis]|uniref:Uncharacterized protein n=1 Tax=Pyropia yezoensis TaxID=2788 RepID=A0ACC3BZW4_PYRYE|nr:hypothetical protein I4F81_005949 [Neopyropia yezoensis]